MKELHFLYKIRHPNLNTLIAYAEDEKYFYIATEHFELGSLFDVLRSKEIQLTMKKRLVILRQVASTLRFLHESKLPILHKDIKSHNVLVSADVSKVSISYFGLGKELKTGYINKTQKKEGTIKWMAPEIFKGCKNDLSTDVYSLAILMWEVFTGKVPYDDIEEDYAIIMYVLEGNRPELGDVQGETPWEAIVLMKRCWDHNPLKRPSMKDVTENLKKIL